MKHYVDIWHEDEWPFQWIGMCACGRGIRCNDGRRAEAFFDKQGCAKAPQDGVSPRRASAPPLATPPDTRSTR